MARINFEGAGLLPSWRTRMLVALVALVVAGGLLAVPNAVDAHGTGKVQVCERTPTNSCVTAVFANCNVQFLPACDAVFPSDPAKGPRDVSVRISNFPGSTVVNLWWLRGEEATDPRKTDCTQASEEALGDTRTTLGTVTTDSAGKASKDATLPPGIHPDDWLYGVNWVCATTAAKAGNGTVGDVTFTVYPV